MPVFSTLMKTPAIRDVVVRMATPTVESMLAGVADVARGLCPVKTGYLQSTIGWTWDQATASGTLYADASYALFVEAGEHARPFLRPALEEAPRLLSALATTHVQVGAMTGGGSFGGDGPGDAGATHVGLIGPGR